jgi:hypothetical protein
MNELILYQPDNATDFRLEVRVKEDTVWLNRHQLAELFNRDIKTIGKHINNALKEELADIPVVAIFATTSTDGKTYQVEHYNLDMIISIGYRVKSNRGIQFRIWANAVLKDYLLKGYSINRRLEKIEEKIKVHDKQFEFFIKTNLPPQEGIFFDGQIYDAWEFATKIVQSAKKSIVVIDNYIDHVTLSLLSKRRDKVKISIFTEKLNTAVETDLKKYREQYGEIEIQVFKKSHDRFVIIDDKEIYHIGASLKDLGKRWFAFSKMNLQPQEISNKLTP